MSGLIVEYLSDREEEIISRSPPPVLEPSDSPRHVMELPMEETDHVGEEADNAVVPGPNTIVTTNALTSTTPTFTFSNPSGEGPSSSSRPLIRRIRMPRYPAINRPQQRRPRPTHPEPPAQRLRRAIDPNDIPRFLAEWRFEEGLINSDRFRRASGPTNIPALTMEPLHDTVPTMVLRIHRAERCITELRERTNILRRKVENQDTQIVNFESEMGEAQFKIHGLEETVLDLQEKIARFEAMFEAISRAATIISSTPSQ